MLFLPLSFSLNHFTHHSLDLIKPCSSTRPDPNISTKITMSWFARSIANSLNLDDDDVSETETSTKPINSQDSSPNSTPRGVKDDLSELTTTLTRQFWGVASFLAPPPPSDPTPRSDSGSVSGIRTDFVEIGEKFRTGISRLSNNINVSEITKVASSFLQLEESDDEGTIGVKDDVVAFVTDLAVHPDTWLNFPLPDIVDFEISDAQQEHALAVERLVPEVAALKIQLCPGYMTESCFWMIYFLLVLPRLDKQDAEILSTPQIVKARELLAPESKNQSTFNQPEDSGKLHLDSDNGSGSHHEESFVPSPNPEKESDDASGLVTGKTSDIQITDKSFTAEKDVGQSKDQNLKSGPSNVTEVNDDDEDEADAWLQEEESIEVRGSFSTTKVPNEDDDEVSFSDLEEDDDVDVPTSYRKSNDSSDKDAKDWVTIE